MESTTDNQITLRENLYCEDGTHYGHALLGTRFRGLFIWVDGDAYDGEWRHGRCHGAGVLTCAGGRRCAG